ncbi:aminopeptidase [Cytobacillus firmus]|uniref:aminopeptidase n=1 Tax=Cytobacillus firmus TaxID=1399 RepID=UPI00300160F9
MIEKLNFDLCDQLLNHSLNINKGDQVFIDIYGECEDFTEILIQKVYGLGGVPYLFKTNPKHLKTIIKKCDSLQMKKLAENKQQLMNGMDAYISIREDHNLYEFNDLPPQQYQIYTKFYQQPIQMTMANIKQWVIIKYPSYAMAQQANMSFEQLLLTYHSATTLNYKNLHSKAQPLQKLLDKTTHIRIIAPETDLEFTKKGIPSYICDGKFNLPDGEIFTAPNVHSVNGYISFNVSSSLMGKTFNNIKLVFEDGKVIKFESDNSIEFGDLIYSDSGSCQVGEFGIGLNPHIKRPTQNILFDEKMLGSIHLALGQCFPMADNQNESNIHFDLVQSHLKSFGGGEIYFDGALIRKDGLFIHPDLKGLNGI